MGSALRIGSCSDSQSGAGSHAEADQGISQAMAFTSRGHLSDIRPRQGLLTVRSEHGEGIAGDILDLPAKRLAPLHVNSDLSADGEALHIRPIGLLRGNGCGGEQKHRYLTHIRDSDGQRDIVSRLAARPF